MKLTAAEVAHVRNKGLCITEKCDARGKLLNQTFLYTIAGNPEVDCSPACRDLVFFGNRREAIKHSTPGKCVYCGASLEGMRRGALYCTEDGRYRHLVAATGDVAQDWSPFDDDAEVRRAIRTLRN